MGRSGRGGAAFGKKIKLLFYRAPAYSRAGDALAAAEAAGDGDSNGAGEGSLSVGVHPAVRNTSPRKSGNRNIFLCMVLSFLA